MFVDARLRAAHHPAPVAVAVLHAMDAFENRRLAGDVIADRALHARHVFRMHEAAPVGRIELRIHRVTQHLLPARREMDFVAFDVEVPEAVVGGALRELEALFELVQAVLDAQASRGRLASELPSSFSSSCRFTSQAPRGSALARPRMPAGTPPTRKEIMSTEPICSSARRLALDRLVLARRGAVADLGEAQMFEAALEPGDRLRARRDARLRRGTAPARRGRRRPRRWCAVGVEQPDEGGVDARGVTQGIEALADAAVDGAASACSADRWRSWCRRCRRQASACHRVPTTRPSRKRPMRSDHQDVQVLEPLFPSWSELKSTLRL